MKLRNESGYEFVDISSELWREYDFGAYQVRIERPAFLAVSAHGHRVLDEGGISHYIPLGWMHLRWQAAPDTPHFVA